MQVETLRDLAQWTANFHKYLSQCLEYGRGSNDNERAQLVLDYLSEQEQTLKETVDDFETRGDEDTLNTWCVEYINKQPIVQDQTLDLAFEDMDADQIIDVISEQHENIIELYRYLSLKADIPETKQWLEKLLEFEEHEAMKMTESAARVDNM